MKRKHNRDELDQGQTRTYDLVLTDISGRSIRAHKALLIDKSDYFARILKENNLDELRLDEKYLIELIHYLYNHELEHQRGLHDSPMARISPASPYSPSAHHRRASQQPYAQVDESGCLVINQPANSSVNGDVEILMQLLRLSRKYGFQQLYQKLLEEIYYKLDPDTVLTVYRCANQSDVEQLRSSAQIMILSWLPKLQKTREFLELPEDAIYDIYQAEPLEIESECKLNALSAWWTRNQEADMTNLWVQLINCTYK